MTFPPWSWFPLIFPCHPLHSMIFLCHEYCSLHDILLSWALHHNIVALHDISVWVLVSGRTLVREKVCSSCSDLCIMQSLVYKAAYLYTVLYCSKICIHYSTEVLFCTIQYCSDHFVQCSTTTYFLHNTVLNLYFVQVLQCYFIHCHTAEFSIKSYYMILKYHSIWKIYY